MLFVIILFVRLTVTRKYRLHHLQFWLVSWYFVDLKALEAAVRSIECDGLEWKASKYMPANFLRLTKTLPNTDRVSQSCNSLEV